MAHYQSAVHVTESARPVQPAFCLRPEAAKRAATWFAQRFPGKPLFAVKANPSPWMIKIVRDAGLGFDVASLDEARRVRALAPQAMMGFMHPVKSPEAIAEAYFKLGIRTFSLDTTDELEKIVAATNGADDLTLCIRLAVSSSFSKISLSSKFGASEAETPALLARARQVAENLGVCFHVGSQAMSPAAYLNALDVAERVIVKAGVIVDIVNVGGGFPAPYPGMIAPPLGTYVAAIEARFERMLVAENAELWCEPGRSLCAEASSLVLRVEARRDNRLYLNDGAYGALYDAKTLGWPYPVRAMTSARPNGSAAFEFFGPTCDDYDYIPGPFALPSTIATGDYVEIGMLGAYGAAMATRFNGFGHYDEFQVTDAPMMTAYAEDNALSVCLGQFGR